MVDRTKSIAAVALGVVLLTTSCTIVERRLQANEDDAIKSVQLLNGALAANKAKLGAATYAQSVSALGSAVPQYLACGEGKCLYRGYNFEYRADGAKYVIVARPNKFDNTGRRSFYTDESGVMRSTGEDRAATAQDRPVS